LPRAETRYRSPSSVSTLTGVDLHSPDLRPLTESTRLPHRLTPIRVRACTTWLSNLVGRPGARYHVEAAMRSVLSVARTHRKSPREEPERRALLSFESSEHHSPSNDQSSALVSDQRSRLSVAVTDWTPCPRNPRGLRNRRLRSRCIARPGNALARRSHSRSRTKPADNWDASVRKHCPCARSPGSWAWCRPRCTATSPTGTPCWPRSSWTPTPVWAKRAKAPVIPRGGVVISGSP